MQRRSLMTGLAAMLAAGVSRAALAQDTAKKPFTPEQLESNVSALMDTIVRERELLAPLRDRSAVIDTSLLRPAQLRLKAIRWRKRARRVWHLACPRFLQRLGAYSRSLC